MMDIHMWIVLFGSRDLLLFHYQYWLVVIAIMAVCVVFAIIESVLTMASDNRVNHLQSRYSVPVIDANYQDSDNPVLSTPTSAQASDHEPAVRPLAVT